ncbi:MAG: ABC transporter ATP-binding protein [Chloroflexi bacterium]|nr:ABC transporter ATP-binding protein [Chloroflexota bacterium]MCC6892817.1 ABC transporter ATP-binding protein [Anaerolineae bacterium]
MIEAHELTKVFDGFEAVKKISLNIPAGSVLAVLGPNGAGKTTTVRMLTSILEPTSGWATVAGHNVQSEPEMVRSKVGVLTEQHGLYERMKAIEYLDFFGRIYRMNAADRKNRSLQLMERFDLTFALDKRLGDYSKGMKQKLALVRAMLHNPPVLLLDEPTSAMDPLSAKLVRDAIIELQRDEQRTFLITTHNLTEAQSLANKIAIIRSGRIIAQGTMDDLSRQFVGEPMMELRVAGVMNGLAKDISDMVTVTETGRDWLRYQVAEPQTTNPALLRRVAGLGVDVVTLSPITRSLEDIYLQVVKEDEGGTHDDQ